MIAKSADLASKAAAPKFGGGVVGGLSDLKTTVTASDGESLNVPIEAQRQIANVKRPRSTYQTLKTFRAFSGKVRLRQVFGDRQNPVERHIRCQHCLDGVQDAHRRGAGRHAYDHI